MGSEMILIVNEELVEISCLVSWGLRVISQSLYILTYIIFLELDAHQDVLKNSSNPPGDSHFNAMIKDKESPIRSCHFVYIVALVFGTIIQFSDESEFVVDMSKTSLIHVPKDLPPKTKVLYFTWFLKHKKPGCSWIQFLDSSPALGSCWLYMWLQRLHFIFLKTFYYF